MHACMMHPYRVLPPIQSYFCIRMTDRSISVLSKQLLASPDTTGGAVTHRRTYAQTHTEAHRQAHIALY